MNTLNLANTVDKDFKHYPIWHPFSTSTFNELIRFEKGNGVYLYDSHGKEYIDSCSGLWNVNLGYGNKRIIENITKQLKELQFCSLFEFSNSTPIIAANKILSITSGQYSKIIYTCSGSESIDLSIKLARKYWSIKGNKKKRTIVSLNGSYHGTYYGSMSVSGIEELSKNGYGPMLPEILFTTPEVWEETKCSKSTENCTDELKQLFESRHEEIAAIIIEPILASDGVGIISDEYIQQVKDLCDIYNILVIFDEVAVGFYRTGQPFYYLTLGIDPDIICMSKGINSGYLPMGAVAMNEKISEKFSGWNGQFVHGSTQSGNVLACAAAIGAIDEYIEKDIESNVKYMGVFLLSALKSRLGSHRNVGNIRGRGLMIAIDLVYNKEDYTYLDDNKITKIQHLLRSNGLLVYKSRKGLTLLPMLIINKDEAEKILYILEKVFKNLVY